MQLERKIKIGTATIHLVFVEGGTFQMGGERMDREKPIHTVNVPSFYITKYLVTQELYQEITKKNPSRRVGAKRPIEKVSWEDAKEFIVKLHQREELEQLPMGVFRLPTEAEWEYAARGGKYSQGFEYCGSDDLKQVGWYEANNGMEIKPVGLLFPNELGLYDMSGNVYEWCEDDSHNDYNSTARPDDGSAWIDIPSRGAGRVIRGGGYWHQSVGCRPANRSGTSPDVRDENVGFRLVFFPNYRKVHLTTHEQTGRKKNE